MKIKSTLIRMFAIMTLATSISAFAQPKGSNAAKCSCSNNDSSETVVVAPSTRDAGNADRDYPPADSGRDKSGSQPNIEEQNRQWLHNLQGIYGG
jgi:hypothetical protein